MEAAAGLKVLSPAAPDMARQLESALQFGQPVLLVDIGTELDPMLEPLLAKAYIRCVESMACLVHIHAAACAIQHPCGWG